MRFTGLSTTQVIQSRKKYGKNEMPAPKLKTAWQFFKEVFQDKLNLILLVLMLIFIGLGIAGYGSIPEAIGIGAVLVVVTITSVMTKLKSQRAAEELRIKSSRLYANVIRNGVIRRIPSADIVVGDIVSVQAGETICADGYLVDGHISVNNAILNGESDECHKYSASQKYKPNNERKITMDDYVDRHSVFGGTTVLGGEGKICITKIGTHTENAKIMTSLQSIDELKTTLQIQLDNLAAKISKFGSVCAFVIFVVLFLVHTSGTGIAFNMQTLYTAFKTLTIALTIFVAAVPEGLPFIIGIITGQNVRAMIKNNILAKNPNKIPEAGNIQLLCTDKTGTLTSGLLEPVYNFMADGTDMGFNQSTGGQAKQMFLHSVALANNVAYTPAGAITGGTSTARALFKALKPFYTSIMQIQKKNTIIEKQTFDSAHKFSGARIKGKPEISYFMGAPEKILNRAQYFIDDKGKTHKINRKEINKLVQYCTRRSMRVVATAYSQSWVNDGELPDDLVFISLIAMRDQIRPGVPKVIDTLNQSGVQVMMITGDILDTARAIATECGILRNETDLAMTADTFEKMTDTQARQALRNIRVIARATPETKLRIVKLAQGQGMCIGMCGDGTNDAPALKRADVGFAMGDGTDVCKDSGDIIITDNNFISVTNSILLGRTFMHNVLNFLKFQLPINFTLVILSIIFPLFFGIDAFSAVQILIINIVMDSLNSLAFGGEPGRPEYLQEPVQSKNAPLLSRPTIRHIVWSTFGFLVVFGIMALPCIRQYFATEQVYMAARFALLVIVAIINGFYVRTDGYNPFVRLKKNPMFVYVALGILAGTALCVTFGGTALQLTPLTYTQWMIVFGLAMLIVPINWLRVFISTFIK